MIDVTRVSTVSIHHDRKYKTFKACIIANMTQKYSTYLFMYSCSIIKGVSHRGTDVSLLCVLSSLCQIWIVVGTGSFSNAIDCPLSEYHIRSQSAISSNRFWDVHFNELFQIESSSIVSMTPFSHVRRLSTPSGFLSSLVLIVILPAYTKQCYAKTEN